MTIDLKNASIYELREAAKNTKDIEVLIYLRDYPDLMTRINVAQNKNLPAYLQWDVYRDKDARVHAALAKNLNLHPEVAYYLEKYKGTKAVKLNLASNTRLPDNYLEDLAKDKDPDIRKRVAQNPVSHPDLLIELLQDEDEEVREAARENIHNRFHDLIVACYDKHPVE